MTGVLTALFVGALCGFWLRRRAENRRRERRLAYALAEAEVQGTRLLNEEWLDGKYYWLPKQRRTV